MSVLADATKRSTVDGIRRQRARTLALVRALPDAQWETIVLPGWRVREVVAHLISTDEAWLTGRALKLGLRPQSDGGIGATEAFNETQVGRWANRPIPELNEGLEKWGRRLARLSAMTPGRLGRARIPLPFGKVSLLWLGMLRVYDEWVHEQDLRRALGLPAEDDPAATVPAAAQMVRILPSQTVPRIPQGSRGRVRLVIEGLPAVLVDLSARVVGDATGSADVTIAAAPDVIMMIAAGRDPWRDAVAKGTVSIEGDQSVAEVFLDALRAA